MQLPTGALPPRIHVVGTSGSGKTTFARNLAKTLDVVHIELDDLAWGPDWQLRPREAIEEDLRRLLVQHDAWVIDGNYGHLREKLIWPLAPMVVWLDFGACTVMRRVFWRTIKRIVTRERLWQAGNRESLRKSFFSRDSILLWSATTFSRRRREYPQLFAAHPHLTVQRLRRPSQAKAFLRDRGRMQTDPLANVTVHR